MASLDESSRRTNASLLLRLRNTEDEVAWREFDDLYRDLLTGFCRRKGLQHSDTDDIVQRVMASLVRTLPRFVYQPNRGRFRDYLFRCVRNAIAEWSQRPGRSHGRLDTPVAMSLPANDGPGGDGGADATLWEQEWTAHHYRLALATVRAIVEPRSIEIFDRSIAGETVARLASEFHMTEEAVRKVRQRIRTRMEELIAAQIREEDAAYA